MSSSDLKSAFLHTTYTEPNQKKIKEIFELTNKYKIPVFQDLFKNARNNRNRFSIKHNFNKYKNGKLRNRCSLPSAITSNSYSILANKKKPNQKVMVTEPSHVAEPLLNISKNLEKSFKISKEVKKSHELYNPKFENRRKGNVVNIFSYSKKRKNHNNQFKKPMGDFRLNNTMTPIPKMKNRKKNSLSNSTAMIKTMHEKALKLRNLEKITNFEEKKRSYYSDKYYLDKTKTSKFVSKSIYRDTLFTKGDTLRKEKNIEDFFDEGEIDDYEFLRTKNSKFKFLQLTPWAANKDKKKKKAKKKDEVLEESDVNIEDFNLKINSIDEYVGKQS